MHNKRRPRRCGVRMAHPHPRSFIFSPAPSPRRGQTLRASSENGWRRSGARARSRARQREPARASGGSPQEPRPPGAALAAPSARCTTRRCPCGLGRHMHTNTCPTGAARYADTRRRAGQEGGVKRRAPFSHAALAHALLLAQSSPFCMSAGPPEPMASLRSPWGLARAHGGGVSPEDVGAPGSTGSLEPMGLPSRAHRVATEPTWSPEPFESTEQRGPQQPAALYPPIVEDGPPRSSYVPWIS